MRLEGKISSWKWFLIGLYLPCVSVFGLLATKSFSDFMSTIYFFILAAISLIILLFIKSDDGVAYANFGPKNLAGAILTGLVMTLTAWGITIEVCGKPEMLLSVISPLSANPLSLIPVASSVAAAFLTTLLAGLVLAATSEELFRLPFFAEGRARWGKKGFKGVLLYVGFPVLFWAALHGLQAYDNLIMIIPAALNGVFLTIYLWKSRCIIGCIFAHWLYNSVITAILYLNGKVYFPPETPLFPNIFSANYFSTNAWFFELVLLPCIIIWAFIFFLLPSLRKGD